MVSDYHIRKQFQCIKHRITFLKFFSSVQFSHSVVSDSLWLHGLQHARPPYPSAIPELAQTYVHRVSDAIQPSHLLSSLLLPSIFPIIRGFSNESVLHIRWPKCWSFSYSISASNEYSGLISFRIDWFDLPAVYTMKYQSLQHWKLFLRITVSRSENFFQRNWSKSSSIYALHRKSLKCL